MAYQIGCEHRSKTVKDDDYSEAKGKVIDHGWRATHRAIPLTKVHKISFAMIDWSLGQLLTQSPNGEDDLP